MGFRVWVSMMVNVPVLGSILVMTPTCRLGPMASQAQTGDVMEMIRIMAKPRMDLQIIFMAAPFVKQQIDIKSIFILLPFYHTKRFKKVSCPAIQVRLLVTIKNPMTTTNEPAPTSIILR